MVDQDDSHVGDSPGFRATAGPQLQDRAVRLFKFLAATQQLKSKTPRQIDHTCVKARSCGYVDFQLTRPSGPATDWKVLLQTTQYSRLIEFLALRHHSRLLP